MDNFFDSPDDRVTNGPESGYREALLQRLIDDGRWQQFSDEIRHLLANITHECARRMLVRDDTDGAQLDPRGAWATVATELLRWLIWRKLIDIHEHSLRLSEVARQAMVLERAQKLFVAAARRQLMDPTRLLRDMSRHTMLKVTIEFLSGMLE